MVDKALRITGLVAALIVSGTAYASEFRAPLTTERGPLRYTFAPSDQKGYRLNFWSASHHRTADRAFKKHGLKTENLTSLIFGESDFRLSKIFPYCYVPLNTEFYNPFMRVMKISPRASYSENGVMMGGQVDFAVYGQKGRIGVRAAVPFRDIQMVKEDDATESNPVLDDLVSGDVGAVQFTSASGTPSVIATNDKKAYRFDLVEALPDTDTQKSLVDYKSSIASTTGAKTVAIAGQAVFEDVNLAAATKPQAVIVASVEGKVPRNKIGIVIDSANSITPSLTPLPANLKVSAAYLDTADRTNFVFDGKTPVDYTAASDDANPNGSIGYTVVANSPVNTMSVAQRVALQDAKAQLWVSSAIHKNGASEDGQLSIMSGIKQSLDQFNEDVFDWMGDRNFVFQTDHRKGLGDIDVDVFYEHRFDEKLLAEATVGLRLPTGNGRKRDTNPYRVHLGNSEHFEIKLGGMGVWQPLDWMSVKLNAQWSFVLEGEEKRCASFAGALIKNIGPTQTADIDWGYLVTRLDVNFFHPRDSNLTSVMGYEFYYRTEDNVHFKNSAAPAWFGRQKNFTAATLTGGSGQASSTTGSIVYTPKTFALDAKVLEKGTNACAHRARWETSYRFSQYFEMAVGGAWTFAGMNVPCEMDFHGGFTVKFQ